MRTKGNYNHVVFLLGSGFSVPAGLPTAHNLWETIKTYYYSQLKMEFESTSVMDKSVTDWWLFPFGKILKSYKNENDINYEDFYDRILEETKRAVCITSIREFVSDNVNMYCNGDNNLSLMDSLISGWRRELVKNYQAIVESCIIKYQNIIKEILSHFNKTNDYGNFESIINNLYLCGNHVDIFTLNHDLLVEKLLQISGISFQDGFDNNSAKNIGRHIYFDAETSRYKNGNVNLYKLHGSIDLYRYTEKKANNYSFAKVVNGDPFMMSNETIFDIIPYFLTGTTAKLKQYQNKYILDLLSIFETSLQKSNKLIIIGYSGNDKGINKIIYNNYSNWSNAIVVSPSATEHPFVKEKQAIPLNKGIEALSLSDLNI